jgi:hypothetical protein
MNVFAPCLAFALPLVWACGGGAGQTGRTAPRGDPHLITAEELATANASNLYDAIRQLRPNWLEVGSPSRLRPSAEPGIMVYVDRTREGGTEALRTIPLLLVESVRWLSPSQAEGEFGLDNTRGAIRVITRHGR